MHSPHDAGPIDLVLLHPHALLVGIIKESSGPLDISLDGRWIVRETGRSLLGPNGETPLVQIRQARQYVCRLIEARRDQLQHFVNGPSGLQRTVGALITTPTTHPDTQIALDVEDHRQQIKVLGFDELDTLAAMIDTGIDLDAETMAMIMTDVLAGRLWHDGQRLLFELGLAAFQLRIFTADGGAEQILPLLEGANIVGRRIALLQHEYRLTINNDDSISNDHAVLTCTADGRVIARDTSTNGTWIVTDGSETRIHHAEHSLQPGTVLRMGMTRMRLEARAPQDLPAA